MAENKGSSPQQLDMWNAQYRFKVDIKDLGVLEFRSAEGLSVQREVLEIYEGGDNTKHHKLIGGTRYSNIVLRRGTTDDTKIFDWVKKTIDGTIERKNGAVIALNKEGKPVVMWEFTNAWPCRYEGPDFIAGNDEVAIEVLELAHDGFKMKKA